MILNEKFDFLMRLTNLSNANMAEYCHYDASYISRLRSGNRNFPKEDSFLRTASLCLAEKIDSSGMGEKAGEAIFHRGGKWPDETGAAAEILLEWLESGAHPVRADNDVHAPRKDDFLRLYYGNSGKREAILDALALVQPGDPPAELLVFSSESLKWFSEDSAYLHLWQDRVSRSIENGGSVVLVSAMGRNASELRYGLRMWMPFLLRKNLTVYRYTKQDKLSRWTLMIIRGRVVITSNSFGEDTENSVTQLATDPAYVAAAEEEFKTYLADAMLFNEQSISVLLERAWGK